jgi:hypothetical protein
VVDNRIRATLACLMVAVFIMGCGGGGELGARSLAKQSDAVESLAAEGALLAQDGVDGKSTAIFTREHAGFLVKAATTTASSLKKAKARRGLEPKLRKLRRLSAEVGDQLKRLDGASQAEEREIAVRLGKAAQEAGKISVSLG